MPINSDRQISIEILEKVRKRNQILSAAESWLIREISQALSDPVTRRAFIEEVLKYLQNNPTALNSLDRARNMAARIARHFNLSDNIAQELVRDAEKAIRSFTSYFQEGDNFFFVRITAGSLTLGQEINAGTLRNLPGRFRIR